jgi:hypothetical protein
MASRGGLPPTALEVQGHTPRGAVTRDRDLDAHTLVSHGPGGVDTADFLVLDLTSNSTKISLKSADLIGRCANLQVLFLHMNSISNIAGSTRGLGIMMCSRLRKLDMAFNHLVDLPEYEAWKGLPSLEVRCRRP